MSPSKVRKVIASNTLFFVFDVGMIVHIYAFYSILPSVFLLVR